MDFQTMSKQRKFVLIAALAGVVGMFLPWYSFSVFGASGSINGMHGNGIMVFICFASGRCNGIHGRSDQNTPFHFMDRDLNLWCVGSDYCGLEHS